MLARGVNVLARLPGRRTDGSVSHCSCATTTRALAVSTLARLPNRCAGRSPGWGISTALKVAPLEPADDGAAVAAFLETLRALRAGPPLEKRAVVPLHGRRGVRPARGQGIRRKARRARARRGRAQTSRGAATADQWFCSRPAGTKRPGSAPMPGCALDTGELARPDRLRAPPQRHGLLGLQGPRLARAQFAFIGGGSAYHRPWDHAAETSTARACSTTARSRSVWRAHLGAADLATLAGERGHAAYFTLPGNVLVRYPRGWELAVATVRPARSSWRSRERRTVRNAPHAWNRARCTGLSGSHSPGRGWHCSELPGPSRGRAASRRRARLDRRRRAARESREHHLDRPGCRASSLERLRQRSQAVSRRAWTETWAQALSSLGAHWLSWLRWSPPAPHTS
jgi:hypothetical protein